MLVHFACALVFIWEGGGIPYDEVVFMVGAIQLLYSS